MSLRKSPRTFHIIQDVHESFNSYCGMGSLHKNQIPSVLEQLVYAVKAWKELLSSYKFPTSSDLSRPGEVSSACMTKDAMSLVEIKVSKHRDQRTKLPVFISPSQIRLGVVEG